MSWFTPGRTAVVAVTALALLATGGLLGVPHRPPAATSSTVDGTVAAGPDLAGAAIARAQQRLRLLPGDYVTWAQLGSAYLERARAGADPTWYARAQGALDRSLALRPADNVAAMSGQGALANARHDFTAGRDWAGRALAVDPYSADAYGVLADALTQLGDPAGATGAVQHMLDLRPGLAAYARASYDLEQHGDTARATALMTDALRAAADPADVAFCRYQLGELAWQRGDLATAAAQYAAGLVVAPDAPALRQGRAKVAAARGDLSAALAGYAALTAAYPAPAYLLEYAELGTAAGRDPGPALALADAAQRLFAANGGTDDLGVAALALARGDAAGAVAAAAREWRRRPFADVADTLAWALHRAGRDGEALGYARAAQRLGAVNARYAYHLGMIELALHQPAAARAELTRALRISRYFSPVDVPAARRALGALAAS